MDQQNHTQSSNGSSYPPGSSSASSANHAPSGYPNTTAGSVPGTNVSGNYQYSGLKQQQHHPTTNSNANANANGQSSSNGVVAPPPGQKQPKSYPAIAQQGGVKVAGIHYGNLQQHQQQASGTSSSSSSSQQQKQQQVYQPPPSQLQQQQQQYGQQQQPQQRLAPGGGGARAPSAQAQAQRQPAYSSTQLHHQPLQRAPQHQHQPQQPAAAASAAPSAARTWSVPNPLSAIPPPSSSSAATGQNSGSNNAGRGGPGPAPNPLTKITATSAHAASDQSRAVLAAHHAQRMAQQQQQHHHHHQQPSQANSSGSSAASQVQHPSRMAVPHPLKQQQQQPSQQQQQQQQQQAQAQVLQQQRAQALQQQQKQQQQNAQQQAQAQQRAQQQQVQAQAQQRAAQQQQQQVQAQAQQRAQSQAQAQQSSQQQTQAQAQQGHYAQQQQQQQQRPQQPPPPQRRQQKVVLSAEAKQALGKAIWSAIRSNDGTPDPALVAAAEATGLPRNAILNAAQVARKREAAKRQQQEQTPAAGQQSRPAVTSPLAASSSSSSTSTSRPAVPATTLSGQPAVAKSGGATAPSAKTSTASAAKPASATSSSRPAPQQQSSLSRTSSQQQKQEPAENPWRRVQSGTFVFQKGKFMVLPNSVSGYTSRTSASKTTNAIRNQLRRNQLQPKPSEQTLRLARLVQRQLKMQQPTEKLMDPNKFRRIKIEPKKQAKALDRAARKARQTAADSLLKTHKDWSKALLSHQTEFFKFHKNRKSEALKVARACRDTLDKEEKQKQKEEAAAERARLAALKSNDMSAYSRLLEDTKNDRLKFLMEKTEESFTQISSLLHQRGGAPGDSSKREGASYYESAHFKSEEVRQPSILVGGDLKEYQLAGLQWLVSLYNNKLNGILADEMGLGKTIQAISLIAYLMEFKHNLGPYLVIVPLSTMSNWENEFIKWCPSARMVSYKGTPAVRKEMYKDQVSKGHFNVLLTTYEYIIKDKKYLRKINWTYAIVDEGHRMKNANSKFAVTLGTHYNTEYRVLLTGTPLMNQLSELWSLLNFLLPSVFNSVETFDQWFSRPFAQFGSSSAAAKDDKQSEADNLLSNEERMLIIHRLHELLRPFMLRRVKSEVLDQLPEKVEKVLRCELSSWQKELYKQISKKVVETNPLLNDSFVQPQAVTPSRGLNNVVMQLRKVCNHPMLFTPEGYHVNDQLIRSSGKVALLDQMLPKLKAAGHRVLIFTQMTAVMTILEDYFSYRNYLSLRLDGSTPAEEREKRMYKFNAPDSPYFIFLLSTRAGGLGLNLTAADTVIIFDSDWNPMMDLQAQDRAHRIGQRSDVSVFRMITNSPVEEKILKRATEKLNVSELVVEAGKFNKGSVEADNSLERKQMMEILLTDFDTTAGQQSKGQPSEKSGDSDNEGDDDDDGTKEEEDLNELLSNNETDYQMYAEYDEQRKRDGIALAELYSSPDDVPDWIKYPGGNKEATQNGSLMDMGDGSRKRKAVTYDDGLTEKQFMRLMDKKAIEEENAKSAKKKARKVSKASAKGDDEDGGEDLAAVSTGSEMTDWTFRKLISCSKAVVAMKDPTTKRKISELFLEKPPPQQFPDYYELIDKPIAINDILRKCRGKLYTAFQEFRDDWKLMVANAIKFNGEGSWVAEDALALEKELERVLKRNGFTDHNLPTSKKPKKKKLRIKLSLKGAGSMQQPSESEGGGGTTSAGDSEPEPAPAPAPPPKAKRGRPRKKKAPP